MIGTEAQLSVGAYVKHDMDPGLAEGSAATSTTAGPQLLTLKGGCR